MNKYGTEEWATDSSELVQKLRAGIPTHQGESGYAEAFMDYAADEIEDLRRERDRMEKQRDIALADLAYLHTAFEDWKVFHSTSRLEVEHAAELYKLRQERDDWFSRCTEAQASVAIARKERDHAEKERDDAIRTAQDNAAEVEKLKADLAEAQKERDDALTALDANWVTHQQIDQLHADLAAARADAERYRWLREHLPQGTINDCDVDDAASWDAAIDAALAAKE